MGQKNQNTKKIELDEQTLHNTLLIIERALVADGTYAKNEALVHAKWYLQELKK